MTSSTDISIGKLLGRSLELADEAHVASAQTKLGNLRAGNSGVLLPGGVVAGDCHRKAHLRTLDLEVDPPNLSRKIMFAGGNLNEIWWLDTLRKTWPGVVLAEDEIPVTWTLPSGHVVSGRPDVVLCDAEKKPVLLLELKSVASLWTAKDVAFAGAPKLPNLAQAAHYMWQLGDIPGRLVYTNYTQYVVPSWGNKQFASRPELTTVKPGKGKSPDYVTVNPFVVIYELRFGVGGFLEFREEDSDAEWIPSIITKERIHDFYVAADALATSQELGGIPATLDYAGDKKNYSNCSYCPLEDICHSSGRESTHYGRWIGAVRERLGRKD